MKQIKLNRGAVFNGYNGQLYLLLDDAVIDVSPVMNTNQTAEFVVKELARRQLIVYAPEFDDYAKWHRKLERNPFCVNDDTYLTPDFFDALEDDQVRKVIVMMQNNEIYYDANLLLRILVLTNDTELNPVDMVQFTWVDDVIVINKLMQLDSRLSLSTIGKQMYDPLLALAKMLTGKLFRNNNLQVNIANRAICMVGFNLYSKFLETWLVVYDN